MSVEHSEQTVGIVVPQIADFDEPLVLRSGRQLDGYRLMYETYGQLNEQRDNAILICHALSGNHHAAGYHHEDDKNPGWWDGAIGPGKPIDTNHFFVIALNNLGGCDGSTGPASIDPASGKPFGPDFPVMDVSDWVQSQARLIDRLNIDCLAAVVGGSLGGMQALRWAIDFPQRLRHCVMIASAAKLTAQNIAFNEVARQSIMKDPQFCDGRYLDAGVYPKQGLSLARMLGHITYLSEDSMREKFGRDHKSGTLNFNYDVDFQIESYLRYQGENFSHRFDANTYLLMTKALDYFDPADDFDGDLVACLQQATCNFLIVSFSTDWRFSPERSEELVSALIEARKQVVYMEVDAPQGHDAFLFPIPDYFGLLSTYLQRALIRGDQA